MAWYDSDECLRPLARLADNACNRAALVQLGLVAILAEFLAATLVAAMSSAVGFDAGPAVRDDSSGAGAAAQTCDARDRCGAEGGLGGDVDMCAWVERRNDCGSMSKRCAREMGLAVEALAVLARNREGLQRMRKAELAPLLRTVAAATRRSAAAGPDSEGGAGRTGWVLRERHLAVAMGQVRACTCASWCVLAALRAGPTTRILTTTPELYHGAPDGS